LPAYGFIVSLKKWLIMKLNSFISVFLCILIFGCTESRELSFRKFQKEVVLKGQLIETELLSYSGLVDIYDTIVIFSNIGSSDGKQVHLFNLNDLRYLASAGTIGRGPNEINNPAYCTVDPANGDIWVMDIGRKSVLKFPVDSIISGEATYTLECKVPENRFVLLQFSPYGDGFYFADNTEPEKLLSFFNSEGQIVDSIAIPDKLDLNSVEAMPVNQRMVFFGYSYAFNPDMKRIAIAYKYSDVVTICDSNGEILKKITGPDRISQEVKDGINDIYCYMEVKADSRFIYARYKGTTLLDKETMTVPLLPKTIHVFNWKGEPIMKIQTEFDMSSFVVDSKNSRLVTYSPSGGTFVTYELPKELLDE